MEASASDSTEKARTQSSTGLTADEIACAAAGASSLAAVAASSRITTRSMARARAAAPPTGGTSPTDPVARLPAALAQLIFLLLPAHDRLRCREVSRAWRAALADGACWRILRFSGCENLPSVQRHPDGLENLIRAASRAAGGAAEEIDFRGLHFVGSSPFNGCVNELAEDNGVSLRALRVSGSDHDIIAAAESPGRVSVASWLGSGKLPHLEELEADVSAESVSEARQLLDDARPPDGRFRVLRIRELSVRADDAIDFDMPVFGVYKTPEKEREVAESLADLLRTAAPNHPSLTGLSLPYMPFLHPGLMDAVADAAVACGLKKLFLCGPHIDHTCLPALSRALRSGRLRTLMIIGAVWGEDNDAGTRTLDGPRANHAEFCTALRVSRLERLKLEGIRLWADPDNGRALLAALTAHPTLESLEFEFNHAGDETSKAAAAEAIAALLEANAPALELLDIGRCGLDGEHLERILGALRGNTHLATLYCSQELESAPGVDETFAERVVLPLVQTNGCTGTAACAGR